MSELTRGNYRVEIKLPKQRFADMPHDWFVSWGAELAADLEKHLGIEAARVSLVWANLRQCENCDAELELVGDEIKCVYCDRKMCWSCNCGEGNPDECICENCWDEASDE